jgi:1-acyl-sn-glycerol-3-phosphate acyltransferase
LIKGYFAKLLTLEQKVPRIYLKEVIRNKSASLSRMMPRFVLNYLRRVVHEEDVNSFLDRHGHKIGLPFVEAIIEEFEIDIRIIGKENIPAEGRYIMAANHPQGGLDGIAFMRAIAMVRQDFVFPVNDILLNIDNLKPFFIPVNKHGSNAENIRTFNETFASDKLLLYFPAGLVSRKKKGKIRDLDWKKTIVSKARQHKRDIVPVYIDARNSNFFYRLANFRTGLGIKANIEMLYLVNETYKQQGRTMTFVFGDPISWERFDRSKTDLEWAAMLREKVYELKKNNNL